MSSHSEEYSSLLWCHAKSNGKSPLHHQAYQQINKKHGGIKNLRQPGEIKFDRETQRRKNIYRLMWGG